ncbi:hypothetical protein ABRQ21_07000 [Latilactobacillus sakei]|uniref:hypothetical protein n=1 Tax=Latilactobacillus sakei TaxID=1599 RepID=UPI0012FF2535|nr:hypothetical protein [Latilactobacillus sakei]MCP8851492.1 hypothetical protein [Latilactobacillus sakei]
MATISIGKFVVDTKATETGYLHTINLDVDIFQRSKSDLADITKFIEEIQKIKL